MLNNLTVQQYRYQLVGAAMKLNGLHHVTAVTSKAQENLYFYTQVLGMRLVKKTVNQDDVSAYHLFYADKLGTPGTDLTFSVPSIFASRVAFFSKSLPTAPASRPMRIWKR
jgi:catechol 2,3-dioxygenase-like lactoylglutathione lyase family enzyme